MLLSFSEVDKNPYTDKFSTPLIGIISPLEFYISRRGGCIEPPDNHEPHRQGELARMVHERDNFLLGTPLSKNTERSP